MCLPNKTHNRLQPDMCLTNKIIDQWAKVRETCKSEWFVKLQ